MDVGMIVKLLKNPSDLPAAAKALGMEHSTIAPGPLTQEKQFCLEQSFMLLAKSAQIETSEVILLTGEPAILKGKRVRILAVLEE